jgi:flavin reductase (DIM6/NTAB) family NADH-FMN oxidoreductase RutF
VASDPDRIAISVRKENYTREIIQNTGKFNLSVLDETVPFETIKRFGMQTGRTVDKFKDFPAVKRSHNGLLYVTENTNAFISCKVVSQSDLGSHWLFIGEVTESKVLSDRPSITYAEYRNSLKK